MTDLSIRSLALVCAFGAAFASAPVQAQQRGLTLQPGDYIAAVVNQDVVAASEVVQRTERLREEAKRRGETLPDSVALHKQAMEMLIEDRVLVTNARESGATVGEPELDRVVANVAAQNKLTMEQLRERLKAEGMDYRRFRENLRDQLMMERVREREVQGRIKISDADIDKFLDERREKAMANGQINVAQILVSVPESASPALEAERRAIVDKALERLRAGEDFAKVAKDLSEDSNKERGGEIGLRAADRLPDVFLNAVRAVPVGEYTPVPVRTGAGFHVLKVIERSAASALNQVTETHARHVLLRPSAQLTAEVAGRRLAEFKRNIEAGRTTFEKVARENSEDGSAPAGGDLGWVAPGNFVPEFEEAMNALPLNGISGPVLSRFGVHLIQVLERRTVEIDAKTLREQARNALREQKYDEAYQDWVRDLRARAFVEMREWLD
jgi:peptidyl-prolyl cis-trans isomerase SurA